MVSASDHNVVTGAIAAQKYQELSLRLQKEYDQSPPKSLVNFPSLLESSMPKLKKHTETLSSSSSGSHRDPTVPFWSIIDQSIRREEMGLAPVNVTYGGSDAVVSWRYNVAETMERTTSPMSNYAPSYATGYSKATGHITEMDPISYDEPVSEDKEAFSDYGDRSIEVKLTIHVPPDMIEDDHALALVQVVPPDMDILDVPETWDIYDLDFAGDPPQDGEELDRPYDGQYDYKEDSTLDSYAPGDDQEEIYDEPGEGSYYSDGEGHNEPCQGSYCSDSPNEDYDEPDRGSAYSDPHEDPVSYSDGE